MAGTPANVRVGPGVLKVAPIGTAVPVDLTTAWNVAWVDLGYTEEGHSFTYTPKFEGVEVAEEFTPVLYSNTSTEYRLQFAAAELTAVNLQRALNGGTITSGTGIVTFKPPTASATPTRVMLGWQADDNQERWVFRKCLQTGATEIARRKAPDKATIPVEFLLEIPGAGVEPWFAIQATTFV